MRCLEQASNRTPASVRRKDSVSAHGLGLGRPTARDQVEVDGITTRPTCRPPYHHQVREMNASGCDLNCGFQSVCLNVDSFEIPALGHQPAQHRRQILQLPRNQVLHVTLALPDAVHQQQSRPE